MLAKANVFGKLGCYSTVSTMSTKEKLEKLTYAPSYVKHLDTVHYNGPYDPVMNIILNTVLSCEVTIALEDNVSRLSFFDLESWMEGNMTCCRLLPHSPLYS